MAIFGGLGAMTRFWLDDWTRGRQRGDFPVGTLVINVLGSLLLGVLSAGVLRDGWSGDWRLVAGTGFCGGFTTFSTTSVETVRLWQQRRSAAALINTLGTAGACLVAAGVGLWLG